VRNLLDALGSVFLLGEKAATTEGPIRSAFMVFNDEESLAWHPACCTEPRRNTLCANYF
jgi:hypothetical protein